MRGSRAGCMCPARRWRSYASREDFSPRPAGGAGRTLIDSGYAGIVEGWSAADPGLPRKRRHTAMRVWQRLREPRVRGFVSVGAAVGQAVAGAASRGVGGVRAARVGAGDRAGGFRSGARVDRGRGACGAFPGGLVPVFEHAVCHGVAGRDVGVRVPRAGRGVRSCRDGAARGGVRQRHGRWPPQRGRHGHADRDVPAVLRAVRVRGEVLQPGLGQRERRRGERGRVRAPQPDGASPVGGGIPGVGDARGSTRANGSRRPTITGSACPSPACSNRRKSICSRCRPPRSTRSSGVR